MIKIFENQIKHWSFKFLSLGSIDPGSLGIGGDTNVLAILGENPYIYTSGD